MKLTLYNGSPRKKKSITRIMLEKFAEGYREGKQEDSETTEISLHYLKDIKNTEEHVKAFADADVVVIGFPLYTDAMPAIVKHFIEALPALDDVSGKKIGFIVHSGFPEVKHSTFVERYLKRLTERLGCEYLGTLIKGSSEGVRLMPDSMNKKLFSVLDSLGHCLAEKGKFDPVLIAELRKPYTFSKWAILGLRLLAFLGITNSYWNSNLKKHNAYDKRFDRPYAP